MITVPVPAFATATVTITTPQPETRMAEIITMTTGIANVRLVSASRRWIRTTLVFEVTARAAALDITF